MNPQPTQHLLCKNLVSHHGRIPEIRKRTSRDCQVSRGGIRRSKAAAQRAPTALRSQGHGVTCQAPPLGPRNPGHPRSPVLRPRPGKRARMGNGCRWVLPVSRANPVMLSGTGSLLRYAGSCTFTMRATLSSTILGRRRPFLSPAPAALWPSCCACAESGGGR